MKKILYFVLTSGFLMSCSASRFVEPIEKDELAAGINFGGPMIDYGSTVIPIPLSSLEVGYGLKEKLTLFGGLHLTSMAFGNLQMDLGATYQFLDQDRFVPNLSISPSLNTIWVPNNSFKVWPVIDINAYWHYGKKKSYIYAGINNYFELSGTKALEQPEGMPLIFSPQIGHVLKGKDRKWEFTAELKLIAPYARNSYSFVPYNGILGENGSTGIYLGYRRYFNIKKKNN
jgi:hypothetical protein